MLWTIIIILLVLSLVGAPVWPYSSGFGWYGSGAGGIIIVILLILLLTGRL